MTLALALAPKVIEGSGHAILDGRVDLLAVLSRLEERSSTDGTGGGEPRSAPGPGPGPGSGGDSVGPNGPNSNGQSSARSTSLEPLSRAQLQEAVDTRARLLVRAASPVWWCNSGKMTGAGAGAGAGGLSEAGQEGEEKRGSDEDGVTHGLSPLVQVSDG